MYGSSAPYESPRRPRGAVLFATVVALLLLGPAIFAGGQADEKRPVANPDLREANVTGVEFRASGTGAYRFDVTLYHDDDGEDGYANWWQVETLDGSRLGRRELLHSHGTVEFTRSATIEIPQDVRRVVVRGHDQTHGYGGLAVVLDLESGEMEFVEQGGEPQDFRGWSPGG